MSLEKRRQRRRETASKEAIDLAVLEDEKDEFIRVSSALVQEILEDYSAEGRSGQEWKEAIKSDCSADQSSTPFHWMVKSGVHRVTIPAWLRALEDKARAITIEFLSGCLCTFF